MSDETPSQQLDDATLVAKAKEGDERALNTLVERHHAAVFRFALGIVGDSDVAADATQDAFLKAVRALSGFRGDASFRTWLFTIASNEAKGLLRRKGRRKETALDDTAPPADSNASSGDRVFARLEVERGRVALDQLPEKQRLAVSLRIFDGLSFREVGEIIESSEGAARVNYHHGIRRLREYLDDD